MSARSSAQDAVARATRSNAFESAARIGYAVSGVLHLLVGYIILQIALGAGGEADSSGALGTLARQTGGAAMLWLAAIGLLALALWRLAETAVGPHPSERYDEEQGETRVTKRLKSFSLAVIYIAVAYSAIKFASGGGQPHTARNTELSARLMGSGAGKAVLIAVGLVLVGVGSYHAYKGFTKRFLKDLKVGGGRWITPIGVVGYIAKGLVLGGAGVLVIVAWLTADPSKATGVDAAAKALGTAPFGKFLLIAAALGIAAFGLYSFVRSRHARM